MTETVTEEKATEAETQKLLKKVVSRLGLDPRALKSVINGFLAAA